MKFWISIGLYFLLIPLATAQDNFSFKSGKKKISIPFQLVNNLIIIPVKVNGVELNFLLDTGVEETILFSLDEKDELKLYDVHKIALKGLGGSDSTEALESKGNSISIKELECKDQNILIVLDQDFNLSSSLGIPVNGIIGYHFFDLNLIKIDYDKKRITIFNREKTKIEKLTKGFESFPITIEKSKPYLETAITIGNNPHAAKLLIDSGNSDALWLFPERDSQIIIPDKNFDDFLGHGFSGDIYGKKGRINSFSIRPFKFENPLAAFPDSTSIKSVKMVNNRIGSIGDGILMRFTVIMDYQNGKIYLKQNDNFDTPFHYNMSGIVVRHTGLQWVQQQKEAESSNSKVKFDFGNGESEVQYKFELKPVYEIVSVRKDSPAEKIGIKKGDILSSINNVQSYRYSLQQINELFRSYAGRVVRLEVQRDQKLLKYKFTLENIL